MQQASMAAPSPACSFSFSRTTTVADNTQMTSKSPFEEKHQLYKELAYIFKHHEKLVQLSCRATLNTLPDAPRVPLNNARRVFEHCLEDLNTPSLNKLGEKLWWASPDPKVVPLSQQLVIERRIQITEDPSVHLLWTDGIIFLKPIPTYLTSFAFWQWVSDPSNPDISIEEREKLLATSLGFLRTYACLIKRRSDFNIAMRNELIASFPDTSFESFIAFIASFDAIQDKAVSSRWRYGLIHLDSLNFHSAIHLRCWHLNRFESRYGAYFSRFFPVVLFIFALFSVMLSAMQVILQAMQMGDTENKGQKVILALFMWVAEEAIGWSLAFALIFVVWWIGISGVEAWNRRKVRKGVKKRSKEECNSDA